MLTNFILIRIKFVKEKGAGASEASAEYGIAECRVLDNRLRKHLRKQKYSFLPLF